MKIKAWFDAHPFLKKGMASFFESMWSVVLAFFGGWCGFFVMIAFICDEFPGFVEWLKLL